MGIAAVGFHWNAREFYAATPHEFFAAFEQWQELLKLQQSWAMQKPAV